MLTMFAMACLLYTSDAADDLLCVDLGGRRNIKKKKEKITFINSNIYKETHERALKHRILTVVSQR